MRRKYLFLITISLFFAACNSDSLKKEKITPRDFSVTKANSYNDLFIDSSEVQNYIQKNTLPDSIAMRMISFYNGRNYEYAWFSSNGLTEQTKAFSSLLNLSGDTSSQQEKLKETIRDLMASDDISISTSNKKIQGIELMLTENLIRYSLDTYESGLVVRKEIERFIPIKKVDAMQLADSILHMQHKRKTDFADVNKPYDELLKQLDLFVKIAKDNKWKVVDSNDKKFNKKLSPSQIVVLKNHLFLLKNLPQEDTTFLMNETFTEGIKNFQTTMGLTPDGKIDSKLWEMLQVNPLARIQQILVNMDRMRWMPLSTEGNLIVVNTPEFVLRMFDGKKEVFSMPVVVGKEGHNTTLFSDYLNTIVFSPYWNVPPSIVKSEILPGMAKNPNYLAAHDMETTGETGGLPNVRQKPGPTNSLGKVKFLFPNSFNIYFHDTPAKSLFEKDVRTFSHGCIRLQNPEELANYLLRNDSKWTPEKIKEAMNSGKETFVKIEKPIPVFITYYTAWVDANGKLNFREDIYGHDKEIIKKMFF
ncbi:MAG: L,D-transpeptidase family protein [Ginsengibacter sp.]|jgi:murein L,D-transpeptidase YcbB/YkuD